MQNVRFVFENPWKKWPPTYPCFCGSGFFASKCPTLCTYKMPHTTDKENFYMEGEKLKNLVKYFEVMKKNNPQWFFKDLERAKEFKRMFEQEDMDAAIRKANK